MPHDETPSKEYRPKLKWHASLKRSSSGLITAQSAEKIPSIFVSDDFRNYERNYECAADPL